LPKEVDPKVIIQDREKQIGLLEAKLAKAEEEIAALNKAYINRAPKEEIANSYRCLANIITKQGKPDYLKDQLLTEDEFKDLPEKYKRKFEKVQTVVVVEKKETGKKE